LYELAVCPRGPLRSRHRGDSKTRYGDEGATKKETLLAFLARGVAMVHPRCASPGWWFLPVRERRTLRLNLSYRYSIPDLENLRRARPGHPFRSAGVLSTACFPGAASSAHQPLTATDRSAGGPAGGGGAYDSDRNGSTRHNGTAEGRRRPSEAFAGRGGWRAQGRASAQESSSEGGPAGISGCEVEVRRASIGGYPSEAGCRGGSQTTTTFPSLPKHCAGRDQILGASARAASTSALPDPVTCKTTIARSRQKAPCEPVDLRSTCTGAATCGTSSSSPRSGSRAPAKSEQMCRGSMPEHQIQPGRLPRVSRKSWAHRPRFGVQTGASPGMWTPATLTWRSSPSSAIR